jgi:hypothetical protein
MSSGAHACCCCCWTGGEARPVLAPGAAAAAYAPKPAAAPPAAPRAGATADSSRLGLNICCSCARWCGDSPLLSSGAPGGAREAGGGPWCSCCATCCVGKHTEAAAGGEAGPMRPVPMNPVMGGFTAAGGAMAAACAGPPAATAVPDGAKPVDAGTCCCCKGCLGSSGSVPPSSQRPSPPESVRRSSHSSKSAGISRSSRSIPGCHSQGRQSSRLAVLAFVSCNVVPRYVLAQTTVHRRNKGPMLCTRSAWCRDGARGTGCG